MVGPRSSWDLPVSALDCECECGLLIPPPPWGRLRWSLFYRARVDIFASRPLAGSSTLRGAIPRDKHRHRILMGRTVRSVIGYSGTSSVGFFLSVAGWVRVEAFDEIAVAESGDGVAPARTARNS